ncbi:hypothetical protein [Pseudomonas mangrovi]|uniref:Uncharacterized protein n=1 Tax=Pseudomonas mangrovi TaxID=2161748 RepID=A0A2T5PE57_9PSED|nr:hypothetical protein [Pseudomonas mangrovi]PTU76014.1 hypothetical protein DBO85_02735 [Pseudomonas mangrovi]
MLEKSLYETTQKIIEDAEDYLLNTKLNSRTGRWLHRQLLAPLALILFGSKEALKPFTKWGAMAFIFLLSGSLILKGTHASIETTQTVLLAIIYGSVPLIMFAAPSTYIFSELTPNQITAISKSITSHGVESPDKIDLIEENLKLAEERAKERIKSFKWLIGTCWALAILITNQLNSLTTKSESFDLNRTLQNNFIFLTSAILATLLALWITISYKRATEAIFKAIKYSLLEIRHSLIIIEDKNQPRN